MEEVSEKSKAYSEIARDIGQVFFASMFIGPIISSSVNFTLTFYGLTLSILAWYLSILFIKNNL